MKVHISRIAVLFTLLALPVAALAQPQKPAPPAKTTSAPAAPQLSEVMQLRLENLNLRAQNLQQQFESGPQMVQIRNEYAALMASIQKSYPGYQWDSRTQRLVRLPTPPAPPQSTKK